MSKMNKEEIVKSLQELRTQEKKKFSQTADLIINLRNFDVKREAINIFVNLPHKIKDVKAAAFLTAKSKIIDTILKVEFDRYKGKTAKKLAKEYDFFIAHASLMPAIATTFGKYLGPVGKMPSPQLGILTKEDDAAIKEVLGRAETSVRIKTKEPSIKLSIGKESMKDEEIAENVLAIYNALVNVLPRKKENVRDVLIKFTMSKPVKLKL
jgi:large subunit ribosomal protein L1